MLVPKILRDLDRNIGLAAFFVMTALLFFQVALRFLVGQSVIGLDELERYLFIALVYLSIAYTERTSGHICFDSFQNALPTHVRRIAKALTTICSLLLFGIALFSAIISMTKNLANKTPILGIPFFVFFLPITVGFLLMTLGYMIKLVKILNTTNG